MDNVVAELPLHIYLVDDHDAFRQSLVWILEDADFQVTDCASGPELLALLQAQPPEPQRSCVLTDLRMPRMSGLELMDALREQRIPLPVVMITGHGDVPLAVEAMRRGAVSFLEKPFAEHTLIETLKQAVTLPGNQLRNAEAIRTRLSRLTGRERQVLDLVCSGSLNKTIADYLGISIKTVELHRANIACKLGTRSVHDLIKLSLGYDA